MSSSIWSKSTFSLSSTSSSSGSSSDNSKSSYSGTSAEAYIDSDLFIVEEKVNAETINEAFKNATESIVHTLKLSNAAEAHFNELNKKLAEKVNDQLAKIEMAKTILEARCAAIQCNYSDLVSPQALEGLFNRHKLVKEKLLRREESLSKLLESAKEYNQQSNVGEISDTIEEVHNRLLILQKDINGNNNELEDKLEYIAVLLEKFSALSFYAISAKASSESYEASLEKIEREEMINDALRQIRHIVECIKKAKEEPPTELTTTTAAQTSAASTSLGSLSDISF